MVNEKCPNGQHDWMCKTEDGVAGEKTNFRALSKTQVSLVSSDSNQLEVVCPDGIIVCGNCETPLVKGETLPDLTGQFLNDLDSKIVKE